MRLLRAKVGGHFVLQNSGWFTVHPGCTSIAGPTGSGKSTLLRALRSVNPPDGEQAAPFADFPRFGEKAGSRRKVLVAQKTAVLAVFVCHDGLRENLASIDPVYRQTDRIEVGRKLDNSRWITFVEIAASGRWSEVEKEILPLRELGGEGEAEELAGFLRENARLRSADRVKGRLAERVNELLDRVAGHAPSEEQRQHLNKARLIVRRAAHYQEAVRRVQESLPVFVFLDRDSLWSGGIDFDASATKAAVQKAGRTSCVDSFLPDLLGLAGEDRESTAARLRGRDPGLASAFRLLGERLQVYLPDQSLHLAPSRADDRLEILAAANRADFMPVAQLAAPRRWMLSCALCACYYREHQGQEVIFLLDEPDSGLAAAEKRELAASLGHLSGSHQLLACTATDASFPPKSGRRYRLQRGENGSTVVDFDVKRSVAPTRPPHKKS